MDNVAKVLIPIPVRSSADFSFCLHLISPLAR